MRAPGTRVWTTVIIVCVICQLYMYNDAAGPTVRLEALRSTAASSSSSTAPLLQPPPPPSPLPSAVRPMDEPTSKRSTAAADVVSRSSDEARQPEVWPRMRRSTDPLLTGASREDEPGRCAADEELSPFLPAASQLLPRCELVVATAILRGSQLLQQPAHCRGGLLSESRRAMRQPTAALCHVAFVDWASFRVLKQQLKDSVEREGDATFIG